MHLALLVLLYFAQFSSAFVRKDRRSLDSDLSDYVCALETNATLNILFHDIVRQEYGAAPETDDSPDG